MPRSDTTTTNEKLGFFNGQGSLLLDLVNDVAAQKPDDVTLFLVKTLASTSTSQELSEAGIAFTEDAAPSVSAELVSRSLVQDVFGEALLHYS